MVCKSPDAASLEPIETASVDELKALQLERLKATISHTFANVAPFRSKCEVAGVSPSDLVDLTDLQRFPFTVKEDLRQALQNGTRKVVQWTQTHNAGTTEFPDDAAFFNVNTPDDLIKAEAIL